MSDPKNTEASRHRINACDLISEEEFQELLGLFLPSADVRSTLHWETVSAELLIELICGASVPLTKKFEWVELLESRTDRVDSAYEDSIKRIRRSKEDIENAIRELDRNPGELFILKELWFDEELLDTKESGGTPFLKYEQAIEYIREDLSYANEGDGEEPISDDDLLMWYELEKWTLGSHCVLEKTYTFYLVTDQVMWFENAQERPMHRYASWPATELNLPVPFGVGDILEFDCRPFKPLVRGIVLETDGGMNLGCCIPGVLTRDEKGKWIAGAMKHCHMFEGDPPMVSPLYRVKKFTGELQDEDIGLLEIKDYLLGARDDGMTPEEKGKFLYRIYFESSNFDESVDEIVGDITDKARIGWIPTDAEHNIEVFVHTDDEGHLPHFHVRKIGDDYSVEWEACIRFDSAEYYLHGKHRSRLPKGVGKRLDSMLREVNIHDRNGRTYWECAIDAWNENNEHFTLQGIHGWSLRQPDYSEL